MSIMLKLLSTIRFRQISQGAWPPLFLSYLVLPSGDVLCQNWTLWILSAKMRFCDSASLWIMDAHGLYKFSHCQQQWKYQIQSLEHGQTGCCIYKD